MEILDKNLAAQDKILTALTNENVKYIKLKHTIDETEIRLDSRKMLKPSICLRFHCEDTLFLQARKDYFRSY